MLVLGVIESDAAERELGLLSIPVYGIVLGRHPSDASQWVMVPADHAPLAGADDVFLEPPARAEGLASLWARLSHAAVVGQESLVGLPHAGRLAGNLAVRLARQLVECTSEEDDDAGDVEGVSLPIDREQLGAMISELLPDSPVPSSDVRAELRELRATGRFLLQASPLVGRAGPLILAASEEVTHAVQDHVLRSTDGRVFRLRAVLETGRITVMPDVVDDITSVRINGRQAGVDAAGYQAQVDLVGDSGLVTCVVRMCLGSEVMLSVSLF